MIVALPESEAKRTTALRLKVQHPVEAETLHHARIGAPLLCKKLRVSIHRTATCCKSRFSIHRTVALGWQSRPQHSAHTILHVSQICATSAPALGSITISPSRQHQDNMPQKRQVFLYTLCKLRPLYNAKSQIHTLVSTDRSRWRALMSKLVLSHVL